MSATAALVLSAALRHAIGDELLGSCTPAEQQTVLRNTEFSPLGSISGRRVVIANPRGSCICGNVNCPNLVLRLDPGDNPEVLLSTYAYKLISVGHARPLPNLEALAHDSALISDQTDYAYRNGTYVAVSSARIRGDNGDRKPNAVPVRFAPGTSSVMLRGSVSLGWYDEYALDAAAGQHLTLSDVHGPATLTFSLTGPKGTPLPNLRVGRPAVLPAGGTYLLHIESGTDDRQNYRATVTIR